MCRRRRPPDRLPSGTRSPPQLRADVLAEGRLPRRGGGLARCEDARSNGSTPSRAATAIASRSSATKLCPACGSPPCSTSRKSSTGKVPVMLNVNGHDGNGKAADYKQIRCINLAKRGMSALNVEWLDMGQLQGPGLQSLLHEPARPVRHQRRGAVLSVHEARPRRAAGASRTPTRSAWPSRGLSGGGWQTIFISSLDTRVTLTNPVAGYSGFRTRVRHLKDLGDSEQTPCDLATVADYTTLTAMMAPRPTLLTYNGKDNCCFEAGYALPPLLRCRPAALQALRQGKRPAHARQRRSRRPQLWQGQSAGLLSHGRRLLLSRRQEIQRRRAAAPRM